MYHRTELNGPLFERRHVSTMFAEYINLQYIHENSICMKYDYIHIEILTKKVGFFIHKVSKSFYHIKELTPIYNDLGLVVCKCFES